MFREMRRINQKLSQEETIRILEEGTSGVLALSGDDGYPYAVPMSYVYCGGKLYFHCANVGHKMDAIARCEKASFCVVSQDLIVPEKFTTFFRSAIAFGRIRVLSGDEAISALMTLAEKYSPGDEAGRRAEAARPNPTLAMLEMTIEHLTGKEAKELASARRKG